MSIDQENMIDQNRPGPGNSGGLILVTGGSGFLGRHLVRALSGRGKKVRALYNSTPPDEALRALPGVSWAPCDLLDIFAVEEILEDVTEIYHCAAVVSFHPRHKERMMHFNVESTANLVNEALLRPVKKFLFVSSVAALGRGENKKLIDEEEQWEESKFNSRYGQSKHLAEMEVWRGAAEGLNMVIVNPGIILGEGNWEEGSARLMKVVDGEFPFYTQGINAWVDVADVVAIMQQLMEGDISNERFILSAGNFSYKDVFTEMARALGKKPPRIAAGPFLTGIVWRWSMFKSMVFGETVSVTKETARTAQKQVFYDNSKLSGFLPGFAYKELGETIARMAASFRKDHPDR